jgi:hypothetical protein
MPSYPRPHSKNTRLLAGCSMHLPGDTRSRRICSHHPARTAAAVPQSPLRRDRHNHQLQASRLCLLSILCLPSSARRCRTHTPTALLGCMAAALRRVGTAVACTTGPRLLAASVRLIRLRHSQLYRPWRRWKRPLPWVRCTYRPR